MRRYPTQGGSTDDEPSGLPADDNNNNDIGEPIAYNYTTAVLVGLVGYVLLKVIK